MISFNTTFSQNAFTQKDREFLIELKVTMEQMDKRIDQRFQQVDQRFQQMDKRIGDIQTYMLWGFGILFTCMIGLFGSIIALFMRDRKIAIKPAVKKITSSSKKEKLFETILKEFAEGQPKLKEILKARGIS